MLKKKKKSEIVQCSKKNYLNSTLLFLNYNLPCYTTWNISFIPSWQRKDKSQMIKILKSDFELLKHKNNTLIHNLTDRNLPREGKKMY